MANLRLKFNFAFVIVLQLIYSILFHSFSSVVNKLKGYIPFWYLGFVSFSNSYQV